MALENYRRKRDFRKAAEPAGGRLRTEAHPMEYRAFAGVIPKDAEAMKAPPGAPVSVPTACEELDEGVRSDQFNTSILPRRLESLKNNPWVEIGTLRRGITAGAKRKIGIRG